MKRIVAILGTALASRLEANDQPPEVERWGQSGTWRYITQMDRWFEVHDQTWLIRRAGKGFFPYLFYMQQFKGPLYLLKPDPIIPNARVLPVDTLSKQFFGDEQPYFTSSIAYMTALAIHEGVDEIRYFGVDMAHKMEYIHQRSGCEYFIGWARAAGIKVALPDSSPILKAVPYGVRRDTKVIQESILERNGNLDGEEKRLVEALIAARARMLEMRQANGSSRPTRTKRYKELKTEESHLEEKLINIRAKMNENEYWLAEEKGMHLTETLSPGSALVYAQGKRPEK